MEICGWSRYPRIDAEVEAPRTLGTLETAVADARPCIARGAGLSLGDSSLAPRVIDLRGLDRMLDFDATTGVLRCEAGVTLASIIRTFLPHGWFLPVVPGTCAVTVGGAIASDVHGKNHHRVGTFGAHVHALRMLVPGRGMVECGPMRETDLFHATCGGMGLTGIIIDAELQLRRVESAWMEETVFQARGLDEIIELFDEHAEAPYSVAWLDCVSRKARGRAVLSLGKHRRDGRLDYPTRRTLRIPFDAPRHLLNRWTVGAFNTLYYRLGARRTQRSVPLDAFFFPLDRLRDWNRLYGPDGYIQWQCVIPRTEGRAVLRRLLDRIAASAHGSFLAVLKLLGPGNGNPLSFPLEGYTLALDFPVTAETFRLLDELDTVIAHHGGRLYLSKDARMSADMLQRGYPDWARFVALRERLGLRARLVSLQARRLEI